MVKKALLLTFLTGWSFAGEKVENPQVGLGTDIEFWRKGPLSTSLQYRHDFLTPHNTVFGVVGWKIGRDPTQEHIKALEAQLNALTRILERATTIPMDNESSRRIIIHGESRN